MLGRPRRQAPHTRRQTNTAYGRQLHTDPSRRAETQIRGDRSEAHRPRSDRRRQAVRAAHQGVQGTRADHRDLRTLPHGPREPLGGQGHLRQRQGRGDARDGPRDDRGARAADRRPRGADQAAAHPEGSAGLEERHRRDPRRHGRRRGRDLRRRPAAHVHQVHRVEGVAVRNHLVVRGCRRRLQGGRHEGHRTERLRNAQIRVGRAPRAARTADRDPGPTPRPPRWPCCPKPRSSTSRSR